MPKKANSKEQDFDFGKSYRELEEIVSWFEGGEIDLDEALLRYERGLALAAACRARLQEVENRVSAIKAKMNG